MKKILAAAVLAALTAGFSAGAAMPFGGHPDRGPGPDRRPPITARADKNDKQLPPGIAKKIEKKDGKKDLPPGIEKKIEKDRRDNDRRDNRRDDRRDGDRWDNDRRDGRKAPPPPRRDDRRDNDRRDNDRRDHDRRDNDDNRGGILGNLLEKLKD